MIIFQAEVTVRSGSPSGSVGLTLIEAADGWTYAVTGVTGGEFSLPWRSPTPEEATKRLQESYPDRVWHLSIRDAPEAGS